MASNALDISKLEDSAAGRALEIWTKAPLTNFVDFTSTLVKGVFDTLIETEMQQTQNYTALVASIAGTLADFEVKTFGDVNVATVNYINEVILPTYGGTPSPFTQPASTATTLTTFTTKDVEQVYAGVSATIGTAEKTFALDANNAILDVELFELTKALLKKQARRTWDDLRALVAAGVHHVDIEDGEIATSLTFHTDSVDSASRDVSNTTTTFANKSRSFAANLTRTGGRTFGGQIGAFQLGRTVASSLGAGYGSSSFSSTLSVNVVNENTRAVTNMSVDVTGSLKLRFRTTRFPSVGAGATA
jgi:hypothetical protein